MTADNRMGSFWPAHDQLRIDLAPSNTYDEMLRAQARIEDWLTAQGVFSRGGQGDGGDGCGRWERVNEPYNQGGVINPDGEHVQVKLELGERVITADQTVYELQACEGGAKWVEVGKGYAVWMGGPA